MKGSKAFHSHPQGWVHNQYFMAFWQFDGLDNWPSNSKITLLCLIFSPHRPDPLPHHHRPRQGLDAGHFLQERAAGRHAQRSRSQPLRPAVRWRDGFVQHPRVSDSLLSHEPQDVSPWYTEMSHADRQLWLGNRWLGLYLEGKESCSGKDCCNDSIEGKYYASMFYPQIGKGISLPRFVIEKYSSDYCNVKTSTGRQIVLYWTQFR